METLASLNKIRKWRKERVSKVNSIKKEIEDLSKNEKYSPEYKLQLDRQLKQALIETRNEYDTQIGEEIEIRERKLQGKFSKAEYEGLEGDAATRELLKEMRNQQLTEALLQKHKNVDKIGVNHPIYQETKKLVEVNSAEAPAHINAMKQLGIIGSEELEQAYKSNNLNDLQKGFQSDLNHIRDQKEAWEQEKYEDDNPFKAAIRKYVVEGQNKGNQ